uniref:Uncharacterized protein n=1 Tax=Romanomermis culicivorax TaxID=13658 RepID=A0A915JXX9_ROMCU
MMSIMLLKLDQKKRESMPISVALYDNFELFLRACDEFFEKLMHPTVAWQLFSLCKRIPSTEKIDCSGKKFQNPWDSVRGKKFELVGTFSAMSYVILLSTDAFGTLVLQQLGQQIDAVSVQPRHHFGQRLRPVTGEFVEPEFGTRHQSGVRLLPRRTQSSEDQMQFFFDRTTWEKRPAGGHFVQYASDAP